MKLILLLVAIATLALPQPSMTITCDVDHRIAYLNGKNLAANFPQCPKRHTICDLHISVGHYPAKKGWRGWFRRTTPQTFVACPVDGWRSK